MITLSDSTKLALTKFKTRRVRLAVVTIVSGMLFIVAVMASLLARGFLNSATKFSSEGLSSRFITAVTPLERSLYNNEDMNNQLKAVDKTLFAERAAEAKRLGIDYDSKSDTSSLISDGGNTARPNFTAPQVRKWLQTYHSGATKTYLTKLATLKSTYGVINEYTAYPIIQYEDLPNLVAPIHLTMIKDGKELIKPESKDAYNGPMSGFGSLSENWSAMDEGLMQPFLLDGQNLELGKDGSIPIVAPYDAVQEAIGITKLSDRASNREKLDRIKQVRKAAAGQVFSMCLRNSSSYNRYQTAVDTQSRADNPATAQAELVYYPSTVPCADVTVKRDTRTAEQKDLDAKREQFEQKVGISEAPVQKELKFRIVGISKDSGYATSIQASLLDALLGSHLGTGWYSPAKAVAAVPELSKFAAAYQDTVFENKTIFLEVKDAATLKRLFETEECQTSATSSDPGQECVNKGKYFSFESFGSNSLSIDKAKHVFLKIFRWLLFIVAAMSSVVLMGTVGKIIADSRKETAVFRAIGAKRSDIAQIYITYVSFIGLAICLFIGTIGFALAKLIANKYEGSFTVTALTSFNTQDLSKTFSLIHFHLGDLLTIFAVVMAGCVVSAVLPLLTNLKRSPMNDMRDER